MERSSLASENLRQGKKEPKVLSTHRAFVQKMNFCSWKRRQSVCIQDKYNGPLWAVLFPPRSAGGGTLCRGYALFAKVKQTEACFFK